MSSAEQVAKTAAGEAETLDLLDQVITATRPQSEQEAGRAKDYFRQFLNQVVKPGQVISKDVEANVKHWVAQIDKVLTVQLNEIIHHPDFQKLESTWRGAPLGFADRNGRKPQDSRPQRQQARSVQGSRKSSRIRPKRVFKKIYEEEYGQLGGQPYGMLVGDYEFSRSPEDISLLKLI